MKSWKEIGIVTLVIAVALGGLYLYLRKSQQVYKPKQETTTEQAPQKGDSDYNEENTTVEVGSKDVTRGRFNRVEDGRIYLTQASGSNIDFPLTDDVVLACSSEDLSVINELDFNYYKKVLVYSPSEIGSHIPNGETVIVFTADVNGTTKAHTIAMDATKCPEEQ